MAQAAACLMIHRAAAEDIAPHSFAILVLGVSSSQAAACLMSHPATVGKHWCCTC